MRWSCIATCSIDSRFEMCIWASAWLKDVVLTTQRWLCICRRDSGSLAQSDLST